MARPNPTTITAEAYARLPADGALDELVRGRVVREPRPVGRHGRVAANLAAALCLWARGSAAGVVYTCDTGFVLARDPDTVRGPDVAFLSRRRSEAADEDRFFEGAPDLAVEVLSPGNRRHAMRDKVADYLSAGATAVWVVDPLTRSVAIHERAGRRVLTVDDTLTMPALLPGLCLPVADLFL